MRRFTSHSGWRSAALFIAMWTLVGVFFALIFFAQEITQNSPLGFPFALRINLTRFYLWAILSLVIFKFSHHFPVEFRPLRVRHFLLHILAILMFSLFHQTIYLTVGWQFDPAFRQPPYNSLTEVYKMFFIGGLYFNLILASLIVIAAHAFLYYQRFRASQVQQSLLREQLAQAQLQALKMQLHPHFLFNALHSISSLVVNDPPRAGAMIAQLGDFLRLTLEHSAEQSVTLTRELEFVRCYLEIENVRFEDRLTVEFKIEPATLSARVPHLILQPLVENAIRHAIAPSTTLGYIKIEASRSHGVLRMAIKDSGPGIPAHLAGKEGVGLTNVRARLKQIYGREFKLELGNEREAGLTVVLEVPFLSESDYLVDGWQV